MKTIRRLRFVATILFAMAAIGCGEATAFDGEKPVIVGTITLRGPIINGTSTMFVVEDGATSNDCYPHRAPFTVGPDVIVFRNGSPADTSELIVGRRVTVFAPRPTIKPCLPSAPARSVFLQ